MLRLANKTLLLAALMVALCGSLQAQDTKKLTIRLLDSKTGHPIQPTGYLIRVDHQPMIHGDWVKQNDDLTGELSVPSDALLISIHSSYDNSMEIYINCNVDKLKDTPGEVWYSVPEILSSGIVSPDSCVKEKAAAKIKMPERKPGEIVLFVRQKNWREQAAD